VLLYFNHKKRYCDSNEGIGLFRTAAIMGVIILSTGMACATNARVLQRNYSQQPHQLIICSFGSPTSDMEFANTQMKDVNWPDYLDHNVTITELSRGRSTNHTPTALGPISNDLPLSAPQRLSSASEYGCATNKNTIIFLGQDGTERGRWSRSVSTSEVFDLIDQNTVGQGGSGASEFHR